MTYKYTLSLCLCIKNEAAQIIDFLTHYDKQGVEHFYIINNNSTDDLEIVIANSKFKNSVTLINDNRVMDIMIDAYSEQNGIVGFLNDNLYHLIKKESEWAIVVDIDEYMYGKNGYTIKSFIPTLNKNVNCVYVIWNIITPNKMQGSVSPYFSIKTNLKRLNYDKMHAHTPLIRNANDFGKSLFRTSAVSRIHLHKAKVTGITINNYGFNKNSWYDNCNQITYSENNFKTVNLTLNHYAIRHQADYIKKTPTINV